MSVLLGARHCIEYNSWFTLPTPHKMCVKIISALPHFSEEETEGHRGLKNFPSPHLRAELIADGACPGQNRILNGSLLGPY